MIGNGLPHKPCGAIPTLHSVHTYAEGQTEPNYWCDGQPVLGPFVELLVRVPLTGVLDMGNTSHEQALVDILDEGLSTYVFDEMYEPHTRSVLRLRQGGKDQAYPLLMENGVLVVKNDPRD